MLSIFCPDFEPSFVPQGQAEHCMMGVQLLSQLTCEMNQISEADANRSLTKHRKIASSFRDSQLFEVRRPKDISDNFTPMWVNFFPNYRCFSSPVPFSAPPMRTGRT